MLCGLFVDKNVSQLSVTFSIVYDAHVLLILVISYVLSLNYLMLQELSKRVATEKIGTQRRASGSYTT